MVYRRFDIRCTFLLHMKLGSRSCRILTHSPSPLLIASTRTVGNAPPRSYWTVQAYNMHAMRRTSHPKIQRTCAPYTLLHARHFLLWGFSLEPLFDGCVAIGCDYGKSSYEAHFPSIRFGVLFLLDCWVHHCIVWTFEYGNNSPSVLATFRPRRSFKESSPPSYRHRGLIEP